MTNLWNDDHIQFPRLIAEIVATQDSLDIGALADSMDLHEYEVCELFDRAELSWQDIKSAMLSTADGCGKIGPYGYRCTHHLNGEHIARGTESGSFAEAWPIEQSNNAPQS